MKNFTIIPCSSNVAYLKGVQKCTKVGYQWIGGKMRNELTAIIEKDDDWYIAYYPEIPGANGQGRTKEEVLENLSEAIALILQDRIAPLTSR